MRRGARSRCSKAAATIVQETRLFDPDKGVTRTLRSKEDAHDYRYFPDPDLLPLELDDAFLEECRASLPELPDAKRKRYEAHGITPYNASVLTAEVETARWFDQLLTAGAEPKQGANWVVAELFGALNRLGRSIDDSPVTPADAAELLGLVADGTISGTIAKQVFEIMLESGEGAGAIVEARGLKQTSDTGAIDAAVDGVLAANADKVAEYKGRQGSPVRLLRRAGDEGDAGQGQSQDRQRSAEGEAGLTRLLVRSIVAAAATAALSASAAAIPPIMTPPAPAAPPKLVIVIAVDMLAADLFDEYRPQFTGGLARLARGTVFRNGYQSHATTETCPGHATMLTGNRPARNGIIANSWTDQSAARSDKNIYCAEDERAPGSTSSKYKLSATHLRGPTLGELMKKRLAAVAQCRDRRQGPLRRNDGRGRRRPDPGIGTGPPSSQR